MTTEPRRRMVGKGKRAFSLSAGLRANPSMFDGKKLSLVGLDIHFIDDLSPKIPEAVKTIYLSNNYLVNLANLDQFLNVEVASIMNNSIRYLDELQSLSKLKKLKALSLQGNIVTRMPFYREHVVNLCPGLTLLDDEKVSAEYRRQCQLKATTISDYFNHLRLNELRNGVLVHICKTMECHAEIRSKFGKDSCYSHSLQSHIKEVEQLGSGAGMVLQVLLQGGVFCWLQRMDCRHFNRLVQDNLYKLLVEFLRQNKGAALQGAELSELWQALGKVYRDDQFDFYSQIIAFCALLQQQSMSIRGHTVGEMEEQQSSKDRDCADHCLSRLQFLATSCPLHCQLPHTADRWKPSMEQQLLWRQEQYHEAKAHHHHQQHRQQLQKEQQMKHQQTDSFSPPPSPPRHAYPPAAAISSVAQPNTKYPPTGVRSNSHTTSSGSNINSNKLVNSHQAPIVQRLNRPQFNDSELHIQAQQGHASRDQGQSRPTVHFVDSSNVLATQDQKRASYSRLLKESEQQRELEQLLQGNGVTQRSRSESLEDLSGQAERHLQQASRSEHVSERYEQLLQQHQHQHRNKQHQQQHQQQHQSQHKLGPVGRVELVAPPPATTAFTKMTTTTTQMNAALPTEKEVMSKRLPPQQQEPELSNNHTNNNNRDLLNVVHSAYAHRTAQKSTEFHIHAVDGFQATVCADGSSRDDSGGDALRGQHQQQRESLEFSAEVVAFIQRGLQSPQQQLQQPLQFSENNGEDADSLEENGNEEDPSSAGCKELEARWLLAGEAVRAHLTSSAQAQDLQKLRATMQTDMARTAALKAELAELSGSSSSSMEVLRGQINKTFDRLNLMERSNLIAHAQYRSVLASLGSFREQALAVADAGVQHLSVQAEEVRSVRKDTQFGTVCLQVHQKSMGRIEELQEHLAQQREQQQQALAEEESLLEQLRLEVEERTRLQAELAQASLSLASVAEEKQSDPAVLVLAKSDRYAQLVASFYPTSLACTSLKKHMFRMLRARTTRQRRVKLFHKAQMQKKNRALKGLILAAWASVVRTAKRGLRLQRWKERDIKRTVLRAWISRFHLEARIAPLVAKRVTKGRLHRAFFAFKSALWRRREDGEKDEKHELYVTLFRSIRIFRAWKELTQASAAMTRRCLAQGRLRALQRLFCAWHDAASQSRERIISAASLVTQRAERRCASQALRAWLSLLQYRSYLGVYRRKKRAMSLLLRRVQSNQQQRRLQDMAGVVAASPQGLMGSKLLVAWKRWYLRTARAKYFHRAAKIVRQMDRAVAQHKMWCTWRAHWQYRRALSRKLGVLAERSADYTLQKAFGVWKAAAALRRARVPHLRHQWLHLFDAEKHHSVNSARQQQLQHNIPPPPLLQAAGQQRRGGGGSNKLRQSLSNFEFQLLYWDDDDDTDNEDEVDPSNGSDICEDRDSVGALKSRTKKDIRRATDYCVLVRHYLGRWWDRARGRTSLRAKFDRTERIVNKHTLRRSLAVMLALYGRTLMTRRNECRSFLMLQKTEKRAVSEDDQTPVRAISGDPTLITRRAEIEALEQNALREREDLRQLVDSLTLDLTAREQELEQGRSAVLDLVSSVAALRAEQGALQSRVRQARDYVQAVTERREEYVDEANQRAEQANHLPTLLARLASSAVSGGGMNSIDASRATEEDDEGDKSSFSVAISESSSGAADERLLLMQDVEALYREAVATQEAMLRKKQHLGNQRQAAQTLLDQRRHLAQELDEQIAALAAERGRAEEALRVCQASLERAFTHVAEQTRDHEALLTALQREEEGLQDRLAALAQQERALAEKVEALHSQREHRSLRTAATSAAHRLGKSEMLLAEHLSHISGSASTSAKANRVTFAHALQQQQQQQQLPQRAHISDISLSTAAALVSDVQQKDRTANAAAAEEGRRALLLLSGPTPGVGTGKENNNNSGVTDRTLRTAAASTTTDATVTKATTTLNGVRANTKTKTSPNVVTGTNKNDKGAKKDSTSRARQGTEPPGAASAAANNHNHNNNNTSRDTTTSQEDVDRQIEALSLRIRQRLTNI